MAILKYFFRYFRTLYFSLLLILSAMLTGCYEEFDPNIASTPVLCMNSLITPGDSIKVNLSRTWRWNEVDPKIVITDADVSLFVNDEFKETMVCELVTDNNDDYFGAEVNDHFTNSYYKVHYAYIADYIPKSGDRIRIEAHDKKYGDASAEVTVPYPVEIDAVETTVHNFNFYTNKFGPDTYWMDLDMLVWFTDPADTDNFFELSSPQKHYFYSDYVGSDDSSDEDSYYEGVDINYIDFSGEPLFTEHVSALESAITETSGYTIFTDRRIKGKSYPLHLKFERVSYECYNPEKNPELGKVGITVTLSHIDRNYYDHVLSVWQANDGIAGSLGSIGFGETVVAYSNVSTKAGVVTAAAPYTVKVPIRDLVLDKLEK